MGDAIIYFSSLAYPANRATNRVDRVLFRCESTAWSEPVPTRIASATIQHRAWTDARRRDSLGTVFGGFSYCPFTVHFMPQNGYIRWNGLKQAKRLTASVDSKHAGLALTV